MNIRTLGNEVLNGKEVSAEEALWLYDQPLEELCSEADKIRRHFCSDRFDLCTIINGKSGRCSEDCRFCAQSAYHSTGAAEYPLLETEKIVEQARRNDRQGVLRYSIVTSGRSLSDREIDQMCQAVRQIREETQIAVCVSFGLLKEEQYRRLKEAGVTRVHNNLETSRRNFPRICTTHTFEDKVNAIRAAQAAGLFVCSGGIMGLGETVEDRIDMALTLRELEIKSVPVNMLNPIPGTPFGENKRLTQEDMRRIVAVYRFLLPDADIRLAGGRGLMEDKGKGCFCSGANAAISGDMLTTAGITVEKDRELLTGLGYEVKAREQGKKLFVTGTGTDVGKTYITGLILKKLHQNGISGAYYKAAMSGNSRRKDKSLIPGDAVMVKEMSGISQPLEEMCPYVYENAVSPHLASQMEGNPVQLEQVQEGLEDICRRYSYVTMEGSGGILCPVCFEGQELWLEDVIKAGGMGCVLVADAGLGTINHVGLTAFYMKEQGIPLRGIIFNHYEPGNLLHEDNRKMCEYLTGVKVVACVRDGDRELDISLEQLEALYR